MCVGGASLAGGDFEDFGLILGGSDEGMKLGIDMKDWRNWKS